MRVYRLTALGDSRRVTEAGGVENGSFFVGDDNVVRWISAETLRELEGAGAYDGGAGYGVYELPADY